VTTAVRSVSTGSHGELVAIRQVGSPVTNHSICAEIGRPPASIVERMFRSGVRDHSTLNVIGLRILIKYGHRFIAQFNALSAKTLTAQNVGIEGH
jgi:hypothetical protein